VVGLTNLGAWLGSYEQRKQRRLVETIGLGCDVYYVGANVGVYTETPMARGCATSVIWQYRRILPVMARCSVTSKVIMTSAAPLK